MSLKKFTLKELSNLTKSKIIGNENHEISGVNSLEVAKTNEASFLANIRYEEAMKKSNAGVICVDTKTSLTPNKNYLISDDPSRAFQAIAELILSSIGSSFIGIHESAVIHPSAELGKNINIGPNVVIDKNVKIKEETTIYPNCYIGSNVEIGKNCCIYSNVSIRERVVIGNRVVIQPGAVIGSCGFGFVQDEKGSYQKLQQIGIVVIEDDVEIGANTTIDRARFDKTIIKKGTKIDNLVQIAHNVEIGEDTAIAAQSGISGSCKIGKNVIMGGQVGVAGHLKLSNNVMIGAQSGISKSLPPGKYRGTPAIPIDEWNRKYVLSKNFFKKFTQKLKELEKKISELEKDH